MIIKDKKIIQRYLVPNTNGRIGNIQLIDNQYFYFYSEIAGGTAGNYYFEHFLIDLINNNVYNLTKECYEGDYTDCQLKDPMKLLHTKYTYHYSE